MFQEIGGLLRSLKHPEMLALAEIYLADEELMTALRRCPAAVSVHQRRQLILAHVYRTHRYYFHLLKSRRLQTRTNA